MAIQIFLPLQMLAGLGQFRFRGAHLQGVIGLIELGDQLAFGQRGALDILTQNGGLESELVRVWTDDTGRYQCEARLLTTHSNGIVLIKPNGYQAVVPLVRLSDGDLQFVRQQVNAKREMLAQQATTKRFAAN